MKALTWICALVLMTTAATIWAEEPEVPLIPDSGEAKATQPSAFPRARKDHQFEEKVVEGVKLPNRDLSGLTGEGNKNKGPLFKKRLHFKEEIKRSSQDQGLNP